MNTALNERLALAAGIEAAVAFCRTQYQGARKVRVDAVYLEGGDLDTRFGAHCIACVDVERTQDNGRWLSSFGVLPNGHIELWAD